MTLTVQYFGLLAERRGVSEEFLAMLPSVTPAEVYQSLDAEHRLGLVISDLRAAVNDSFVPWSHVLADGDRVAFMPPMSGG
jgi:molybdopterin converting factor small subunit